MIASAEEFVRLRTSEDPQEYLRAASEPAELEVWREVIRRYPEMREWVAHNKSVPISVLEVLADEPDERVRSVVAMKNKLTAELFAKLASDSSDGVRTRVAHNRNTPPSILRILAEDCCTDVAEAARSRIARSSLQEQFEAAFLVPYASHSWASAKGKSYWRDLEFLEDALAGPICSVIEREADANMFTLGMMNTSRACTIRILFGSV